jgi:(2Fe-2S) ferredoxin
VTSDRHHPIELIGPYPEGVMYGKVQLSDVNRIIDEHLVGGKPVETLKVPKDVWD